MLTTFQFFFRCLLASQSVGGSQSSNLFPWVPQVWLKFDYGRWNATLKGFNNQDISGAKGGLVEYRNIVNTCSQCPLSSGSLATDRVTEVALAHNPCLCLSAFSSPFLLGQL